MAVKPEAEYQREKRHCPSGAAHNLVISPRSWGRASDGTTMLTVRCSECGYQSMRAATRDEREAHLRELASQGLARGHRKPVATSRRRLFALRVLVGFPAGVAAGLIVFMVAAFLSSATGIIYGTLVSLGVSAADATVAALIFPAGLGLVFLVAMTIFLPEAILEGRADKAAVEAYVAANIGEGETPTAPR